MRKPGNQDAPSGGAVDVDARRRRWLKFGAAGVLVVGVVAILFSGAESESSQYPDSPEDAVQYLCAVDQHGFTMTPRQLYEARRKLGEGVPGYAPCPKCRQHTARRAHVVNGKLEFESEVPPAGGLNIAPPLGR